MYIIGIDVGGTNLKVGLIQDHKIIDKKICPTNTFDVVKQIISETTMLIEKNKLDRNYISHIGIGFPGIIIDGRVKQSANLKLFDCDLSEIISCELGIKTIVYNDGDMATIAEYTLGGGRDSKNMILLTIGTGVGGGIIIDGHLYTGSGGAGELGHQILYKDGIQCNCGRKGCAEKYVSAIALSNRAKEQMAQIPSTIEITNNEVYASSIMEAYNQGDNCAKQLIESYTDDLCELILNICNVFRPDKIVVGGGITHAKEIIKMTAKKVKDHNYGYIGANVVNVCCAELGNDAGILGADCL